MVIVIKSVFIEILHTEISCIVNYINVACYLLCFIIITTYNNNEIVCDIASHQVQATSCRRIVLYGHAVLLRHVPTDKVSDKYNNWFVLTFMSMKCHDHSSKELL